MLVSGLQKLTLLDYPGKVACTIFTGGCNFRCPFCHNAGLVLPEQLSPDTDEEQVLTFLKRRQGMLDGVAITGGEPLLHRDTMDFLGKIRDMGYSIKLDTNGSFPDRLEAIIRAGLVDRVAMDVKTAPEEYGTVVGIPGMDISAVTRSKELLMEGRVDYEFRTTVVKGLHTRSSLIGAAKWIAGAKEYYLQQFKDSGNLILPEGLSAYNEDEMRSLADAVSEFVPGVQLRGVG